MKDRDVDPDMGPQAPDATRSATPTTLLQRLKERDGTAWQQLLELYGPTVEKWCRRAGVSAEDAADLRQEVFAAVARKIAEFRRDRPNDSFRGWLWTITHHKLLDHTRRLKTRIEASGDSRAHEQLLRVPDEGSADSEPELAPVEAQDLYERALRLIQTTFEERTWRAFWLITVDGQRPADVAAALGMTPGAVYIAKSRVLKRLREEFADLI